MKTLYVKDRREWRAWLRKNFRKSREVWLLHYKKNSGKPRIPYDHAVEEALCFGWIDSKVRRMDKERFAQVFTPRKSLSRWSPANVARAKKMIAEGKMTPAGLKAFSPEQRRPTPSWPQRLPRNLASQFRERSAAWSRFQSFPPYYRRVSVGWVASAKKEETKRKCLKQLIECSARNERLRFM
jgi:uncharacterized protein YdeI (YjbR/CyaY-like superfamily)